MFVTGTCEHQPFPDNHFDVVISTEAIEHVHGVAAFLKEAYRVLKPNGYLFVTTPNLTGLTFWWGVRGYTLLTNGIKKALRRGKLEELPVTYGVRDDANHYEWILSPTELRQHLLQAAFAIDVHVGTQWFGEGFWAGWAKRGHVALPVLRGAIRGVRFLESGLRFRVPPLGRWIGFYQVVICHKSDRMGNRSGVLSGSD